MTIHSDHPFASDPSERDEARRFRGRLASPVTIVTSGSAEHASGLTVSSLLVIEGDPPVIQIVVAPTTDLWYSIEETGRFVVHVCVEGHGPRSDVFAGLRPSPGGPFANLETGASDWGPTIADIEDRAYCTSTMRQELGYSGVISANVDALELTDMSNPLVYFRGSYRALA